MCIIMSFLLKRGEQCKCDGVTNAFLAAVNLICHLAWRICELFLRRWSCSFSSLCEKSRHPSVEKSYFLQLIFQIYNLVVMRRLLKNDGNVGQRERDHRCPFGGRTRSHKKGRKYNRKCLAQSLVMSKKKNWRFSTLSRGTEGRVLLLLLRNKRSVIQRKEH